MKDLAPAIYRQRLVIEGIPARPLTETSIADYLTGLSNVLAMRALIDPVTHRSPMFGWAGWIHWETSGAHLYAWDVPQLFFSVDIYTCKAFDESKAVQYTIHAFNAQAVTHASPAQVDLLTA